MDTDLNKHIKGQTDSCLNKHTNRQTKLCLNEHKNIQRLITNRQVDKHICFQNFKTFNPLSDAVDEKHRIRLNPQFFHRIFFGYFDGSDGSLKQVSKFSVFSYRWQHNGKTSKHWSCDQGFESRRKKKIKNHFLSLVDF